MLPVMPRKTENPDTGRTRLNVAVDADLHKDLRKIAAETNEPFTQLVPRLLREAARAEKKRLSIA